MSDVTNGAPATGDASGTVLSSTPAVTPPAVDPATVSMPSDAFKARLDETAAKGQAKLLKKYGFEKETDLEAALAAAKALQAEKLTETEKRDARIKELEPQAAKATVLEQRFAAMIDEQFRALPESVQTAIDKTANGDASKRDEAMSMLRASGLLNAAPVTAAAPVQPAPKTVAPSPAPTPSGAQTKFQEWEAMRERNPMLGAMFFQTHQHEIEATRPASS